jgi:hypothetical protein
MGITTFKCPHCKRIIDMTDGLQSRMQDIGNPIMKCQYCGGLIRTGAQEWVDQSKSRKIGFWIKMHIAYGTIYGAVLGLAAWALVVEVLKKSNQLGIIIGSIVFIFIFYSMHRAYNNQVKVSLKRKS